MGSRSTLSGVVLLLVAPFLRAEAPRPPMAPQRSHVVVWHGQKVEDPFFWLREKSNPVVIKYLEGENAYTEAMTRGLKPFADELYKEMLGHIKQTDLSVPTRRGGFYYYSRTQEGKQYPIYCRKVVGEDAKEQVILDVNELAQEHKFYKVSVHVVSDDGNLLAYSSDTTGFRDYTLHVKDLRSGKLPA